MVEQERVFTSIGMCVVVCSCGALRMPGRASASPVRAWGWMVQGRRLSRPDVSMLSAYDRAAGCGGKGGAAGEGQQ